MHPCLQIPELLKLFFDALNDKKSLSYLSRACSTFKEPALDALYTEIDGSDFLLCLPSHLWSVQERTDPMRQSSLLRVFTLKRDISQREWDTLLRYTARVKCVSLSPETEGSFRMDISVWKNLSRTRPVENVFPMLRTLRLYPLDTFIPSINLFLSPELCSLDFLIRSPEVLAYILQVLPPVCLGVEAFHVTYCASLPKTTKTDLADVICQWPNIRSLTIPSIDERILRHLTKSQGLGCLHFDFRSHHSWLSAPSLGFRSMTHLSVRADSINATIRALKSIRSSSSAGAESRFYARIRHVQIDAPYRESEESLNPLLELTSGLGGYVAHDHLAEMTLHLSPDTQLRGLELLRPLRVFTHLSRLSITGKNSTIDISFDALQTLLVNWPCLEAIQIITLHPFLTLPQLFGVLEACPRLQICGLGTIVNPHDVDALLNHEDDLRVYGPYRNVELLILGHATEETQHVRPTVQVLSRVVPQLKCVGSKMDSDVFDSKRTAHSKFWVDVLDGIQGFNKL
ncbi:hypothetical protein CONPUDRAFT_167249 [Coniophora puteana RWD-64-598 SS2]|uniref:F-box domain-containing protein n=1 Tax=Coniophora puteana (strain RWD-64-598) TaxID=741705 RepID=A0A5M3MHC7_CONPW|nr:uncharacterized protein CONPUDRAFT_167249 [Coniophora puteana RWD-64-598 SS2]EIW78184.1 hypothetical protein CONPUDRAFT_167249 [Coniophora puteana RWD-64-598 SS2]